MKFFYLPEKIFTRRNTDARLAIFFLILYLEYKIHCCAVCNLLARLLEEILAKCAKDFYSFSLSPYKYRTNKMLYRFNYNQE